MSKLFSMRICAVAFALVLASPLHAQSEEIKIGYVNTERVLREAAPAKAAEARLTAEFGKREKELTDMQANLKARSDRLDREAAVMSDTDRNRLQREFAELDKDFQRRTREFREDANQKRNEEMAQVIDKANAVIREIARAEKYDFILQEAVFASPKVDITDKVLKALSTRR